MTKENLTRSLKNDRNNKDLLRTEINHATDPNVRLELTKMLLELEKEEKRKRIRNWIIVGILLICILLFLLYLGTKPSKNNPETSIATKSSSTEQSTDSTTTDSKPLETNLTEEQLKKWVMAILDLTPPPPTRYLLDVYIDEKDKLAYIQVGVDQLDNLGTFRVNAQGQLEANGPITGSIGNSNWVLMSEKYLDTSIAEEYLKTNKLNTSQNKRQLPEILLPYSDEEIEYARVWLAVMGEDYFNQVDIDDFKLNVSFIKKGTSLYYAKEELHINWPSDVVLLTGNYTAQGQIFYSSNFDGTVTVYPMPSHWHQDEKDWNDDTYMSNYLNDILANKRTVKVPAGDSQLVKTLIEHENIIH